MSRVNSDIRLRIVGEDATGPAFDRARQNMRDWVRTARQQTRELSREQNRGSGRFAGIGFGGRAPQLPFGLQLGGGGLGAGLGVLGIQRSLQQAEENANHFRRQVDSLPQIKRMNSLMKDAWKVALGYPGEMLGQAAKAVGFGPGYVQEGKVPQAYQETMPGHRSSDMPSTRLAAATLERAKQIEAQIQADDKATEEMRNRAGQQTGQASIALFGALRAQDSAEKFTRVGTRLRDVGLNMFGGMQTNLRGLGIFGAGVGRAAEGLGMGIGDRFGRRNERQELLDSALDPRAKRIKDAMDQATRVRQMERRGELAHDDVPGIIRGMLRDAGLSPGAMPGGVGSQVGGMVTSGTQGNPLIKGQADTNKKLDQQNTHWKNALTLLQAIAKRPVEPVVGL